MVSFSFNTDNLLLTIIYILKVGGGFPGGSVVKNLLSNARDIGSIHRSGRSPGGGNGNSLQYSCLGNSMHRGAWQATAHGVAKSQTQLNNNHNNNKWTIICQKIYQCKTHWEVSRNMQSIKMSQKETVWSEKEPVT